MQFLLQSEINLMNININITDKEVPLFSLVDDTGNTAESGQLGLLLYQGGTVCNEFFNNQTAEAICRRMNFSSAIEWKSELESEIQKKFEVAMKIINCPDVVRKSEQCTFSEVIIDFEDNCFHRKDVFLKCTGQ